MVLKKKNNLKDFNCLELCCGNGRNTRDLFITVGFEKYAGLDFDFQACQKFVENVKREIDMNGIESSAYYINKSLQSWKPQKNKYCLIFGNWTLEYIEGAEISEFIKKLLNGLRDEGLLVLK